MAGDAIRITNNEAAAREFAEFMGASTNIFRRLAEEVVPGNDGVLPRAGGGDGQRSSLSWSFRMETGLKRYETPTQSAVAHRTVKQ
jgi:hypothetical protein